MGSTIKKSPAGTAKRAEVQPLRVLTFTSLYPNQEQPRHGIFVENRMKELSKAYAVDVTVVAPVPWFPFKSRRFGSYANYARVEAHEHRYNLKIYHPRYLVIPKIGMNLAPRLMYLSLYRTIAKLHREHKFDLIDGHFFYPDGVVATMLGAKLGLPVVNTARGNDITLYPQYRAPRKKIVKAIEKSHATIGVCSYLVEQMREIAPEQKNSFVMRNGVDLDVFKERNREQTRAALDLKRFTLLSVGGLIERKGHHLIVEAMKDLPDSDLLIIGDGPMDRSLQRLIDKNSLNDRVRLLGLIPHDMLPDYYSAADCLVLASSREGWANVLLEAMACGTPVVATAVSGTPEVITSDEVGVLLSRRAPEDISRGVRELIRKNPKRSNVRRYAEGFSWNETSDALFSLFSKLIHETRN